ncbi:hypothetical protein Tdes44962_MAKER05698 [Teratosphaeria destructans]|uniref:Uncharacterized protein n=1 Tax=Teratosphaeria destructans TaxID=418781 RepID=A0A9W7VYC0_9PEZI|nr:hypothetical protein Tdes44962_MAKER05698 [Teratosphaeria destructans]
MHTAAKTLVSDPEAADRYLRQVMAGGGASRSPSRFGETLVVVLRLAVVAVGFVVVLFMAVAYLVRLRMGQERLRVRWER